MQRKRAGIVTDVLLGIGKGIDGLCFESFDMLQTVRCWQKLRVYLDEYEG